MDEKELANLLERYKQGMCSEEERRLVESLYLHTYGTHPVPDDPVAKKRVWKNLKAELHPASTHILVKRIAVAASVLMVAAIGVLLMLSSDSQLAYQEMDIPSGGNKAVLKLADGRTLALDSSQQGIVILADELLYTDNTSAGTIQADASGVNYAMNEIQTPRGGTYQVVLGDGTKVWLNAESKLEFPQRFMGGRREVSLVGEAYFEVAHDKKHPFVVITNNQEVVVLGTSFNITAYEGDPSEQTTLINGEVAVETAYRTHYLTPGDQAAVYKDKSVVEKVDTSPFIAWKEGFILFNEKTLEQIMGDISRWYDIDIHFENERSKQLRFGGTVSRYENVSQVLKRLELTEQVKFRIEERRIVVTP